MITFYDLLQKNNYREIDLLHIDTEGFDYKILRSIDFSKYNIRVVIFEGKWMTRSELKEIIQYFRKFKYRMYRCGIDYAAVK